MNPNPWIKISEQMPELGSHIEIWDAEDRVVYPAEFRMATCIDNDGFDTGVEAVCVCLLENGTYSDPALYLDPDKYVAWRLPEPEEEWPK